MVVNPAAGLISWRFTFVDIKPTAGLTSGNRLSFTATSALLTARFFTIDTGQLVIQTSAEPVRVLHITDPHLFADPTSILRGTVTHSSLLRVIRHIEKENWPADLVAMTGDLIQDSSRGAYEQFCELLTPLGLPVHCVPGNHDARDKMIDAVSMPPFYYCDALKIGDWLIVGIDSTIDGAAGGRVSVEEMQRMQDVIEDTPAEHILLCLHHPPVSVGRGWIDEVGMQNGPEFVDFLGECKKVRAAIFGHVHQAFDANVNDIKIIGTPSTCTQFEPNAEKFALDDKPPAYRRIELGNDGSVVSELIWLD